MQRRGAGRSARSLLRRARRLVLRLSRGRAERPDWSTSAAIGTAGRATRLQRPRNAAGLPADYQLLADRGGGTPTTPATRSSSSSSLVVVVILPSTVRSTDTTHDVRLADDGAVAVDDESPRCGWTTMSRTDCRAALRGTRRPDDLQWWGEQRREQRDTSAWMTISRSRRAGCHPSNPIPWSQRRFEGGGRASSPAAARSGLARASPARPRRSPEQLGDRDRFARMTPVSAKTSADEGRRPPGDDGRRRQPRRGDHLPHLTRRLARRD